MRLWSLHPQYLDRQGLLALWREGLLAQKVLANLTKGYKHHPQLSRFREMPDPLRMIAHYLLAVAQEAEHRGYRFDQSKIQKKSLPTISIPVSRGQIEFERHHLLKKLKTRDRIRFQAFGELKRPRLHPIFHSVPGEIHSWEKL